MVPVGVSEILARRSRISIRRRSGSSPPPPLARRSSTAPAPLDLDEEVDPYGMQAEADAAKGATDAAAE
jgi:hypothetical protein